MILWLPQQISRDRRANEAPRPRSRVPTQLTKTPIEKRQQRFEVEVFIVRKTPHHAHPSATDPRVEDDGAPGINSVVALSP